MDRIPQRSAVRRPQKAEQFVSFSSQQQTIDIPVPGRGGGGGRRGLQGFFPQNKILQHGMWVYIDKSLKCQWSCKAFRLPVRVWKNSTNFPCAVSRSPHLNSGHYFYEPLYLAGTCPGVHASVNVAFGRISVIFFVLLAPEPFAHGNLDTTSGFPRWLVRRISSIFYVENARILRSIHVLHSWFVGFHGLQHGEVCTVGASIAWSARACGTWNLDIISSALDADRHLAAVSGSHEKS